MSGRSPKRAPGQGRGGRAAAGRRSGPPRSRGAGRTGQVRAGDDAPKRRSDKGLGGEQVEGRQAVRELLLAQRRKVHEIWISTDLQDTDAVDDIVAIASANRVPIAWVARKKLEAAARSEAPQGVAAISSAVASAARSWWRSTASPTRATSARSSAVVTAPASTRWSSRGIGRCT